MQKKVSLSEFACKFSLERKLGLQGLLEVMEFFKTHACKTFISWPTLVLWLQGTFLAENPPIFTYFSSSRKCIKSKSAFLETQSL